MNSHPLRGQFVWYELMTSDVAAAKAFYGNVIGWQTQPFGDPNSPTPYTMWVNGQGPLGGTMKLPEEAVKAGTQPHWSCNAVVNDVATAVAAVKKMGGTVLREPVTMPGVGTFALIADPQGATLSLFTPSGDMAAQDPTKHGAFCWNELMTTTVGGAFEFYRVLFGWEHVGTHDLGEMGSYLMFGVDGRAFGGVFLTPKDVQAPPMWSYYVTVNDLDATITRAKANGATLVMGPMEVPGGDRVAQLLDPQGAMFGLAGGASTTA